MDDESKEVYRKAIRYLALKRLSKYELQQKLLKQGFRTDKIELVIQICLEKQFLDDESYQQDFLLYQQRKGRSSKMIEQKMKEKFGSFVSVVSKTDVDAVSLDNLLKKKSYQKKISHPEERKKVILALIRKGFSLSLIKDKVPLAKQDCQ
ncbi:MAG: regulatory protein RecX [Rhabdochlamydiaceae bacterium]